MRREAEHRPGTLHILLSFPTFAAPLREKHAEFHQ
jgi:hypothetical protein